MYKPSIGKAIGIGFFVVIAITVFPAVTMLLWNWLVPTLFSGPVITYWQALGLIILSKILFSSGPRSGGHHHRHRHHGPWKSHLREKMEFKYDQAKQPEQDSSSGTVDGPEEER